MREILFRGKLKSRKEWSYGNLNVKSDEVCIITPDDTLLGKYGQVDPETVGQYTSLIDSNGTRIFEGDIVLFDGDEVGLVKWDDETARFIIIAEGYIVDFYNYYGYQTVVIGNRYDSPELLEDII